MEEVEQVLKMGRLLLCTQCNRKASTHPSNGRGNQNSAEPIPRVSDLVGLVSNRSPGEANAAGLRTTLGGLLVRNSRGE